MFILSVTSLCYKLRLCWVSAHRGCSCSAFQASSGFLFSTRFLTSPALLRCNWLVVHTRRKPADWMTVAERAPERLTQQQRARRGRREAAARAVKDAGLQQAHVFLRLVSATPECDPRT
ncbi:hypothetical protein AOLI_G00252530 [Acnodon oligacanthus]